MLLTISTTYKNANELSYLLHKHPNKLQSFDLKVGHVKIFYPEYSNDRTTVAMLLDVNPIDLVKKSRKSAHKNFSLGQYVNDRPYVASSFMSVAIAKAFSSAMNGNCKDKPELVDVTMPFEITISVLPAPRGGALLIRKLFEPLGYALEIKRHILDEKFEDWGESKYYKVTLKNSLKLKDLLSHLYVLIPALDNDKHYFVSQNEIDKLLEKGRGWLETHPEKEQIIKRYLINLSSLTKQAIERLGVSDDSEEESETIEQKVKKETLHQQRLKIVFDKLVESKSNSVIDLGCGEGKLIRMLLKERQFQKITGMDISNSELNKCKDRLYWEEMAPKQKDRINLFQGALTYKDKRLEGYDAAALVEVIEHIDQNRLPSLERVVFEFARPKTVLITTPNKEYNALYDNLQTLKMRHDDHRFEWTRNEFHEWANRVAQTYNYSVHFDSIGTIDEKYGSSSQMAIFKYEN